MLVYRGFLLMSHVSCTNSAVCMLVSVGSGGLSEKYSVVFWKLAGSCEHPGQCNKGEALRRSKSY